MFKMWTSKEWAGYTQKNIADNYCTGIVGRNAPNQFGRMTSMCVYIYIYCISNLHVCKSMCIHIYIYMYMYMHTCTVYKSYVCVNVHAYMYSIYKYMHIHTYSVFVHIKNHSSLKNDPSTALSFT